MEPNPHPAQVPPAARSLQVHDKRRLGSTLSSNHILRHRKTCLSFPKTYFELLQTVSLFPKTTFCVNSNHGMKSVVYSPCSSNHILRHRKTCLSFPKTYFELLQTVSLFPKTTFCVNSNHGMKSVVYKSMLLKPYFASPQNVSLIFWGVFSGFPVLYRISISSPHHLISIRFFGGKWVEMS